MDPIVERFETLDPQRWIASYLPAWSSRRASAAAYQVGPDGLTLSIPADHPQWCPGLHDDPALRVSAVQSGNWSGPVGSEQGQQPFRPGLVVIEEQPRLAGLLVQHGRIEVECRAGIGPGSMFSAWMIGMEDAPERCGEICLIEIFGSTVADGHADAGSGIHAFRDPALAEEFSADRRRLDPGDWHVYAVDWSPAGVTWFIDGEEVRRSTQSPAYPMLLILGVFDFPAQREDGHTPVLQVRQVRISEILAN